MAYRITFVIGLLKCIGRYLSFQLLGLKGNGVWVGHFLHFSSDFTLNSARSLVPFCATFAGVWCHFRLVDDDFNVSLSPAIWMNQSTIQPNVFLNRTSVNWANPFVPWTQIKPQTIKLKWKIRKLLTKYAGNPNDCGASCKRLNLYGKQSHNQSV